MPKPRYVPLNLFVTGANSDMLQERGDKGVPPVELSNFDTSPSAPSGKSLLQAKDGYTLLNMLPAQSNPDGQATDGSCTLKAYTFPGVRGNLFALVCNGATGASVQNGNAGKYRLVSQSFSGVTPSVEFASQNTGIAYPILQDALVGKGQSAATNQIYAIDKDSLVSSLVPNTISSVNYLTVLCGQTSGQFAEGCQFFAYRPSAGSVSIQFAKYQDQVTANIGSTFSAGYTGTINFTSWYPDVDGNGIWVIDGGWVAATGRNLYHVEPAGVTAFSYDTVTNPGSTRTATAMAPVGADDSYIILVSHPTGNNNSHHFEQVQINNPTAGKFKTVSLYNNFVFFPAANTLPSTGKPANLTNIALFDGQAPSWTRGPDGYYYFIATPPYTIFDGVSDPYAYFQRTNLYKVGFTFVNGVIDSMTTPNPTVQFTPTEDGNIGSILTIKDDVGADCLINSPHVAILSNGAMCIVGQLCNVDGTFKSNWIIVFINPDKTQGTTTVFTSNTHRPSGVSPWYNSTKFLVVGCKGGVDNAWAAVYSSSGVLEDETVTPNAGFNPALGPFDPLGQNGGS